MSAMKLKIEEHSHPNPAYRYGVFFVEGFEIGRADKKPDGWVLVRKRKVLTANEAALAMVKANLKDAQLRKVKAAADEAGARMMLLALRKTPNKALAISASPSVMR
jgi:hypothetical protein